jgi:hypothetical protein
MSTPMAASAAQTTTANAAAISGLNHECQQRSQHASEMHRGLQHNAALPICDVDVMQSGQQKARYWHSAASALRRSWNSPIAGRN